VDSSSRTASGSRLSDRGVKPTRSANSIETTRRSLTGPGTGAALDPDAPVAAGAAVVPLSGEPHSEQNFPDGAGAPQVGHVAANELPHSAQNFASGRLAAPQLPQSPAVTPSSVPE